jgi:hypothetical protein
MTILIDEILHLFSQKKKKEEEEEEAKSYLMLSYCT